MAVIDLTTKQNSVAGLPAIGGGKVFVVKKTINCVTNNIGSADTAKIFLLPAYTQPLYATCLVTTAEGGTATIDLGITGSTVDALLDGTDLNAAGYSTTTSTGSAWTELLPRTVDYNISILANNALDAAIFDICVFVLDLR
jgi:hypothetical protein